MRHATLACHATAFHKFAYFNFKNSIIPQSIRVIDFISQSYLIKAHYTLFVLDQFGFYCTIEYMKTTVNKRCEVNWIRETCSKNFLVQSNKIIG